MMTWVALLTAFFGAVSSGVAFYVMWKSAALRAEVAKISEDRTKMNEAVTEIAKAETPEEMHEAIKDFATSWKR